MRELGGGGTWPPPKSQSDGGADVDPVSGGWRRSSGELEKRSWVSGMANPMESSSACKGMSLHGTLRNHMDEGEATLDAGIASDAAVRCIRDFGGGGPRPPPNSRPDGGADSGLGHGGRSLSSGGREGCSWGSSKADIMKPSPACEGTSLTIMSGDLMEEGEAIPDVGKTSCDNGMTEPPLDINGKKVLGDIFSLGTGEFQIAKNVEFDDHLGLHVAGGMHGHILPHPDDFCMDVNNGTGTEQSIAMSLRASIQGGCGYASPS